MSRQRIVVRPEQVLMVQRLQAERDRADERLTLALDAILAGVLDQPYSVVAGDTDGALIVEVPDAGD